MFFRKGKEKIIWSLALFFLCALIPQWSIAAAPAPLAVIQSGTERALKILHSSRSGEAPSLRQRRGEILTIVDDYFNFEEMAKRALGRPWKEQPENKRKEFVALFRQLLFNTYISRVESYTGTNEQISYDSEKIDGDYAIVKTRVVTSDRQAYQIDYRLRQEADKWKVYDVIVEGVSFVENYRSQFASILTSESFDSLLKKLRDKVNASNS